MRWVRVGLLTAVLLALLIPAGYAGLPGRRTSAYVLGLTNGARAARSVALVAGDDDLASCALWHARRMAEAGRIWHSSCGRGENVGAGPSMGSIFKAFLRSEPHRDNIYYTGWRRGGVGVARDADGVFYISVVFT